MKVGLVSFLPMAIATLSNRYIMQGTDGSWNSSSHIKKN